MIADLAHAKNSLSEEKQRIATLRSLQDSWNNAKKILALNKSIKIVKE